MFDNPPVNASLASNQEFASPFGGRTNRRLFTYGTDLVWVLYGEGSSVIRSSDGGITWAIQDPGVVLPTLSVPIFADVLGDLLCFVLTNSFTDQVLKFNVVRFDLLSSTYISVSDDLDLSTNPLDLFPCDGVIGGAIAGNGEYHLGVAFADSTNLDLGPFSSYVESGGIWSEPSTLDTNYANPYNDNGLAIRDSAGDVHWIYETQHSRSYFPENNDYPYQLRHVKDGGESSLIQSVDAPDTTSFNICQAIVFNGQIYLANIREGNIPTLWISDSDTEPTSWTEKIIDDAGGSTSLPDGVFTQGDGSLYFFYRFHAGESDEQIWVSILTAGVWSDPSLSYDPATNPVAGLSSPQARRLDAAFLLSAPVFGALYFIGNANAIFLGNAEAPTIVELRQLLPTQYPVIIPDTKSNCCLTPRGKCTEKQASKFQGKTVTFKMPLINSNQLSVSTPMSQYLPEEGPRAVPMILDYSSVTEWVLDMELLQSMAFVSMIQSIYVDTSDLTAGNLNIIIGGSGQVLKIPFDTQGYYSALVPNPVRITFQYDTPGTGELARVQLINVPVPGASWSVL